MKEPNYAPVYAAALYPQLAQIARDHGWALAVHGSMARDFDLICVPWRDFPEEPATVVTAFTTKFAIRTVHTPEVRHHGRLIYTIIVGFGECFIDLSFMPRIYN